MRKILTQGISMMRHKRNELLCWFLNHRDRLARYTGQVLRLAFWAWLIFVLVFAFDVMVQTRKNTETLHREVISRDIYIEHLDTENQLLKAINEELIKRCK